MARISKFLFVGVAGFLCDFSFLWFFIRCLGLDPISGRLSSFACAVAFTYALNRRTTFADRPYRGPRQIVKYFLASAIAGLANLFVYIELLSTLGERPLAPFVAMPVGVAVGLVINFTLYNFEIFKPERESE
jgi:putative flippase GtrA